MEASIKEIDPLTLKKELDGGEIILIDVREHLEYEEEHISRAQLFPISNFEPRQLPDPAGKTLVFYCQMGRRSTNAALKWAKHVGAAEAFSMKGGLKNWKDQGLPTVTDNKASVKVEEQTYILSGIVILVALVLNQLFSEWFLVIPTAIAILLIISGIAGHSYLSFLLSKLPWNR
ncbi:MAG: rhodanese-like domain-containing protein [Parachlamydiaceae bacterium]|nr:rhodanese-like domain-containing protein [Parachlamydiaceae bacterium]